jgi:hypothetical protein
MLPPDVFFQVTEDPSIKIVEPKPRMVSVVPGEDWRAPIMHTSVTIMDPTTIQS